MKAANLHRCPIVEVHITMYIAIFEYEIRRKAMCIPLILII